MAMGAERKSEEEFESRFADIMNKKIENELNRWKNFPVEKEHDTLNELFSVITKLGVRLELRVKSGAIFGKDSDAILPQEAMIYGYSDGNEFVFNVPPSSEHWDGPESYSVFVSMNYDISGKLESRLSFGQSGHSTIASFKSKDVVSVRIR